MSLTKNTSPTGGTQTAAAIPQGFHYPPPPAGATPATIAAYQQQYYQQYYQYVYSMYNNPASAAAMMQAYGQSSAAAAAAQGFYTQAPKPAEKQVQPPPPPPPPIQTIPSETPAPVEPKIKINIKFNEDKPEPRKSRFNVANSINNVVKEQQEFKAAPTESKKVEEEKEAQTRKEPGSDIVFDINKWPPSLKEYCAKVYKHYQTITLVSEDQVTKYLQKKITDAFKIKPDLNIAWDKESLPDMAAIRQVAPLSQYQIEQQKRQQQLVAAQIEAKKKQLAFQQKQKEKSGLMAGIKESMKRKSRSPSRSSESEQDEDENYISFSKKSVKRKSSDSDDVDESPKKKLSKKEKRKLFMEQKRKEQEQMVKQAVQRAPVFGLTRKIQSENNLNNLANSYIRKPMKNIFQLAKEQDMEHDEAVHAKNICVGVSQDLEKEYLRLTGPPEPCMVRSLEVLKKSLDYVLKKYQRTNDYRYICDQMKAIRQDLTVQQIRNEFTIEVYETHARIAIKNKDRDEFNQCQNQLKSLYNLVSSKTISLESYPDNSAEFIGYRLLYNMLTKSYKDIDQLIKEIKQKYSLDNTLKHLLELKQAWYLNNYVKFFKLYKKSNFMCKCLIEQFVERERKQALKSIIKSYRPSIKLEVVSNMLAYETVDACKKDLLEYKINLIEEESSSPSDDIYIDCKSCNIANF